MILLVDQSVGGIVMRTPCREELSVDWAGADALLRDMLSREVTVFQPG